MLGLAATVGLLAASPARATDLPPGSVVPTSNEVLSGGTLIASASTPVSFAGSFNATLVTGVYREASGNLTFLYQVTNSSGSPDPLHRVTATDFTGYTTDAGYSSSGVGGPFTTAITSGNPLNADRSGGPASDRVVGFSNFGSSFGGINPGQTSPILVIRTNAHTFAPGTANVIDGGVASGPAFRPTPEPASAVILGGCVAGLMGAVGLRRGRKPVAPSAN